MNDGLHEGLSTTRRIEVDAARTIDFMGEEVRVYATPELVRDIEVTCRDLLLEHIGPGKDSVGVRVELDHLAATLIGMWVDITVKVKKTHDRLVSFEVECHDPLERVASGVHNRVIVGIESTAKRLAEKRAKVG
ncbi:MAG: hypothetical protein DHS20C01_14590 [marine bacterium B5-7]|nr:MAG: hypothetical protein DHS20C01_14590 [marine bacterium B5-7]